MLLRANHKEKFYEEIQRGNVRLQSTTSDGKWGIEYTAPGKLSLLFTVKVGLPRSTIGPGIDHPSRMGVDLWLVFPLDERSAPSRNPKNQMSILSSVPPDLQCGVKISWNCIVVLDFQV